jgi:hypothetical protein
MAKKMKRIAFLLSLFLITLHAANSSAARKIFVRDIVLTGSCVKEVSVDALRALLAQEMPRDILAHRGLAYEDLSSYMDVGSWNAESFTVRDARNIMRRVRQFDMKMMLWLEASCMPAAPGKPSYFLTGRLMDLDRMDEILTCQDMEAKAQRRVCHGTGDVFDAVSFAQVEMDSFSSFVPAVRHLLARLLRIPEIEVRLDTAAEVFDPGQIINLSFSVRRNDAGQNVPIRYVQQIARLPIDQREQICRSPAQYWEQHNCTDENSDSSCLEHVPFEVAPVRGKKMPKEGGPLIQLRAPSYDADYLVRAEVIANEAGGEIRSTPVYRCIKVRQRKYQLGLNVRLGVPLPNEFDYGITVNTPVFGLDLYLAYAAIRSVNKLPGLGVAAVLGVTYAGGSTCIQNPNGGDCFLRFSRSFAAELRGQVQLDALRVRSISFRLIGDLGVALENVSTTDVFSDDGVHALLLGGLGVSAGGHFGLSPRWDLGWTVGVMYQLRYRSTQQPSQPETLTFPGEMAPMEQLTLGQGVPTTWQPLWFSLGLRLDSPTSARGER